MCSDRRIRAGITALAIFLGIALVVCNLDHNGPMLGAAGHSGTSGHSDSTVLGCGGDLCLTLVSKAMVTPEQFAAFLLFPILLLSPLFSAYVHVTRDSSPPVQRSSFYPRLASNKRYRELSIFLV